MGVEGVGRLIPLGNIKNKLVHFYTCSYIYICQSPSNSSSKSSPPETNVRSQTHLFAYGSSPPGNYSFPQKYHVLPYLSALASFFVFLICKRLFLHFINVVNPFFNSMLICHIRPFLLSDTN